MRQSSDWRCEKWTMEIKLNLIPPKKKEEIKKNKRLKTAIKAEIVLTIILMVFFSVLLSFRYVLGIELTGEKTLNAQIERNDQFGKIKSYDDQFNQANDMIKQVAVIDQTQLYWSRVFVKISQLILPGIETKSLSTDNSAVTISGIADTRDNLIAFKSNLEKESCFSQINLPLSNLVDKENVTFQIVFDVDKKCLKK